MSIDLASRMGGIFAILVFWHFLADWVFQSHKEAMKKANDWKVRFRHCWLYAALFMPLLVFLKCDEPTWLRPWVGPGLLVFVILFLSHFIIDTYIPVMLWAKYLRRAPQFNDVVPPVTLTKEQYDNLLKGEGKVIGVGWSDHVVDRITYKSDAEAFKAFFATPVGAILCITMDQFFHIAFLLPVAYMLAC